VYLIFSEEPDSERRDRPEGHGSEQKSFLIKGSRAEIASLRWQ